MWLMGSQFSETSQLEDEAEWGANPVALSSLVT